MHVALLVALFDSDCVMHPSLRVACRCAIDRGDYPGSVVRNRGVRRIEACVVGCRSLGKRDVKHTLGGSALRVSGMGYDVARVRGSIPSLGDGWIHLDPQLGMLIPDRVSTAVSTAFRHSASNHSAGNIAAKRSAALLESARVAIADLVGAYPSGVVIGPDRATLLSWLADSLSSRLGLGTGLVLSRLDEEANVAPWLRVASRTGAHVRWAEVEIDTCELPTWQFEELITSTNYYSDFNSCVMNLLDFIGIFCQSFRVYTIL